MLSSTPIRSVQQVRSFNVLPREHRRAHTHLTISTHNSNYFGGRYANFRLPHSYNNPKKTGMTWRKHLPTLQYNVDVWSAQQTLRKKWKGRNWRIVEMPFEKAPALLQKVIPEEYTELPIMADPRNGDYSNIRRKTFSQEELQEILFGTDKKVLPMPVERKISTVTLDSFFSNSGSEGAVR